MSTSVTVGGADVYVGCSDGRLFRVRAQDGDPRPTLSRC
ncbi:MAG: hypothetical protein JSU87_06785 [Gemmatimonadota bacterium]|nr:MAG: hypothetical protein JSU87_06785 [Gemmatimonadota bacterium]